jgi:hypothetical protein
LPATIAQIPTKIVAFPFPDFKCRQFQPRICRPPLLATKAELTSAVLAPTTVVDSEDDLEEIADPVRHPACPRRHAKPGRLIRPTNLIPSNPQAISTAYQQHDTKGILITRKSLGYTHSTVSKAIDFSGKCPTKSSSPPRSKQWNDDQISRLITNFWHSYSFLGDSLDRTELEKALSKQHFPTSLLVSKRSMF